VSFFKKLKSAISKMIEGKGTSTSEFMLEDLLIEADFGPTLSSIIADEIKNEPDLRTALKTKLESILLPLMSNFSIDTTKKPFVILLEGVNGSGKTTTVAKLAFLLKNKNISVDIAACDTFRAAATEQLSLWVSKLNCKIFKSDSPRDPASVVFEALSHTKSDTLIIDTAGRLQNNVNLMSELEKIHRVMKKIDESAPHMNVLIMDATTGQNLIEQARAFEKIAPISGIIINKMDGGSKGGAIVRVAYELKLPILGVGIGESERDLENFSVDKFLKDFME
jgi:fused signal recognition particle receptor